MGYRFTTTARRAMDLATVLDTFSPAEAAKLDGNDVIKNIKMVEKLVDEIKAPCGELNDYSEKCSAITREVALKAQEEILKIPEDQREKEGEKIAAKANADISEKVKALASDEEVKKLEEAQVNVNVSSNDRFSFLKVILPKLVEKYKQRKALIETVEAIEGAKED